MKIILILLLILEIQVQIAANTLILFKGNVSNVSLNADSNFFAEKVWEINFNEETTTDLIVSEDKIFINFSGGLVYCLDLNGNEKWAAEILGNVHNNSVHFKDLFLSVTDEGDLYSINANNGDVLQVIGIGENITSDLSLIDLTANGFKNKGVVFGTSEGNIFCYDIFSFEIIWKLKISDAPIISKPLVTGDKIIFTDLSLSNYSVNSNSGILLWKFEQNNSEQFVIKYFPFSNGKYVFTISPLGDILAIDLLLGKKIWSTNKLNVLHKIYLTADKEKLITFNNKGEMILILAKEGKEMQNINLQKSAVSNFNVAEINNFILITLSDGSVKLVNAGGQIYEILMPDVVPASSISVIHSDKIVLSKLDGKLLLYKIRKP
jgi:outer membrane protein assembly factor BamB